MKVLSLFDGMACGYEALVRAGIPIDAYYASEIDKYAIQVALKNHPDIIEIGDITQVKGEDYKDIDLIIGGSPCQGFSIAGKMLNFEDPRSKLFFEFVRLVKEIQPKYFLLENVKMKKEFRDKISEIMGCEPILIDSALVSAQHRERYYWTNIPGITQPEDKGILLKDILEDDVDDEFYLKEDKLEKIKLTKQIELPCGTQLGNSKNFGNSYGSQKAYTLRACQPNGVIQRIGGMYGQTTRWGVYNDNGIAPTITASMGMGGGHIPMIPHKMGIRKLTPIECERLQTLPDNYTEGVSDTQRYKMLGNGWTVDVISHIFKHLKSSEAGAS